VFSEADSVTPETRQPSHHDICTCSLPTLLNINKPCSSGGEAQKASPEWWTAHKCPCDQILVLSRVDISCLLLLVANSRIACGVIPKWTVALQQWPHQSPNNRSWITGSSLPPEKKVLFSASARSGILGMYSYK